jgi:sulfate adenylyltransferase subunit 2
MSGGKDAIAVLDLCVGRFKRIECFFMYLVKGLEIVERSAVDSCARHKVPLHFVPHFSLSRLYKQAILMPHVAGASKLRKLKLIDTEKALRKQTGIDWFAYGERAADSFARRLYTRKNDGVDANARRLYPVYDWSTDDILSYLRGRNIPVPLRVGYDGEQRNSSGFNLSKESLAWLKRRSPKDYARVLDVFPYAEMQFFKCGAGADEVPEVQG